VERDDFCRGHEIKFRQRCKLCKKKKTKLLVCFGRKLFREQCAILKVWGNATFSKLSQTPVSNRIKKDWKYFWRKHLNGGRRPRNNWKPSWRWGAGLKTEHEICPIISITI
jgi:hypothetical protein